MGRPSFFPAGSGRVLPAAGGHLLASVTTTGGAFSLLVSHAPSGDQVPRHVHHEVDEAFFVLSGRYQITCGDQTWHAGTHDFAYLPRGVPHAYLVTEGPASTLILSAPGGLEGFFDDLAAGASPDELSHRHGVTFLEEQPGAATTSNVDSAISPPPDDRAPPRSP